MSKLPEPPMSLQRYLTQQKRLAQRQADSSSFVRSGMSVAAPGMTTVNERVIAGTLGGARVELDANGLHQYAADGTSVLAASADNAMFRARGDSTAVGANAQALLTTGTGDTAVGSSAQQNLTTGNYDTAVGALAQKDLTTGYGDTAVGVSAQQNLTTGYYDTAVGVSAQEGMTTGYWNTAIGPLAQVNLSTGFDNTAVGAVSQRYLTTGHDNTAVGSYAQDSPLGLSANATITASYQTSIGPETGQSSPTQVDGITTIGYRATAGAANATSIGREARADHAGSIALGYQTLTTQPNQVMIGGRDIEITSATKGVVLVAPNATRWRLTVSNAGALVITAA